MSVVCPYCNHTSELVEDSEVYRRSYGKMVYLCRPCNAWVGCHRGGCVPLGRLANAELRALKIQAHALFDVFWRAAIEKRGWKKGRARGAAYGWLARETGIPGEECHIGMMDEERCRMVIAVLQEHHARIRAKA